MKIRTYQNLIRLNTFEERFEYLRLNGITCQKTFGHDRYLNQELYRNNDRWKKTRDEIIIRDNGCDLGLWYNDDYKIYGTILIHHLNPLTKEQIENLDEIIFDHDNLISTCLNTHNAIHYGAESLLPKIQIERFKNDTCPWKE